MIDKYLTEYDNKTIELIKKGLNKRIETFRINTIKSTKEEIEEYLKQNNINYKILKDNPIMITISDNDSKILKESSIYKEGKIYFQSLSSILPAVLIDPKEKESILDMASSPGGKTSLMQSIAPAYITAVEKNKIRCERLKYNLNKLGCTKVSVINTDATKLDEMLKFNKILLDAPCSGLGTININEDNSYINDKFMNNIINTQSRLLDKAYKLLKSDGYILYSTCSIYYKENEEQLDKILNKYKDLELININNLDLPLLESKYKEVIKVCPTNEYEGFFISLLHKKC